MAVTRRALLGMIAAFLALGARTPAAAAAADDPRMARKWRCLNNDCDPYIYDPMVGDPDNIAGDGPIPPGTAFEDLPDDWLCPLCGEPKSTFAPYNPV